MVFIKSTCDEIDLKGLPTLIDEVNANKFLKLEVNNFKFGLRWYDYGLSEPEILFIEEFDLLVIGVGSTVVAISVNTGVVKFGVGLSNPFNFLVAINRGFIIVSETTILVINAYNCSLSRFTSAPDGDIIQDLRVDGEKLIVTCLSNTYTI